MYADPRAKMAVAEDLVGELDAAGFDAAVIAGFAFAGQADIDEQNEHLREAQDGSPGRLRALASVNPAQGGWEGAAEG